MKTKKLVNELNNVLDMAAAQRRKHQEKLESFRRQVEAEEQNLRLKLEAAKDKADRKKLKSELNTVKKAFALLAA